MTQPKERVHVMSHESHPRWSRITEPTELPVDPFREKVEGFVNECYNYYVNEIITRYLDLVWHDKRKKERKERSENCGNVWRRERTNKRKKKKKKKKVADDLLLIVRKWKSGNHREIYWSIWSSHGQSLRNRDAMISCPIDRRENDYSRSVESYGRSMSSRNFIVVYYVKTS